MNDILKETLDEIKIIECNADRVNSNIKSIFNILKYKIKMKNFKNKITCKLVFGCKFGDDIRLHIQKFAEFEYKFLKSYIDDILKKHKLVYENLIKQEKFEQIYYMFSDIWEYDYSTKIIACAKTAFENEEKIILKEWI